MYTGKKVGYIKKKVFFKKVIDKISCADINVHKTNKLFLEV